MNYETISIKYCVCLYSCFCCVAMQIGSFLCHIRLSYVACLALLYFPYLINDMIFRKSY
jgi:hypothetical protein